MNEPFNAKEFEDGKELARNGEQLPNNASDSTRQGYESESRKLGMSGDSQPAPAPAPAADAGPKTLLTHKTSIGTNTDRPEPKLVGTPEPPNPNENVTITVIEPGKVYEVKGIGSGSKVNFYDCTVEALLACAVDRLENGPEGSGEPSSAYERNASADVRRALDQLRLGTRERLEAARALPVVGFSGTAS